MSLKQCHHCSGPVNEFSGIEGLKFVSSDSRTLEVVATLVICESCGLVQKDITQEWLGQTKFIYESYDMSLTHPGPRLMSDKDGMTSVRVDQFGLMIADELTQSKNACLLDVGTGNGDLLRSISAIVPELRMDVLETSSQHREAILSIPGVEEFFLSMDQINKQYEVISLSHVLEHVVHPSQFMQDLKRLLAPHGVIAIQLPNYVVNCVDLVIYDHASHFEPETLKHIVGSAGFEIARMELTNGGREISCVTRPSFECISESISPRSRSNLAHSLSVLQDFSVGLEVMKSKTHYVFGAGNGGAWAFAQCRGEVEGFVEDDASRIGGQFLGRSIFSRKDIVKDCALSIPIFGNRASQILNSFQPKPATSLIPREGLEP